MESIKGIIKNKFYKTKKMSPSIGEIFYVFNKVIENNSKLRKISSMLEPVEFKKSKLFVNVLNHNVAKEFLMTKRQILSEINDVLDQELIQDIQIKT